MSQVQSSRWIGAVCALIVAAAAAGCAGAGLPPPIPTPAPQPTVSQETQSRVESIKVSLKAGKLDQAQADAEALVKAEPNNSTAYYLLGNAHNQMAGTAADEQSRRDHLAKAVDAYLTAIRLDPNNDAAHTNLATVYYQNAQFDEAQKYVEAALKLKPDDATSHYVLGTIYLQRDPTKFPDAVDNALKEFEAAVKFDPNLGAAYIGLANVYLFKNDPQKAAEYAQKGIDLTADAPSPFSYWALAQAQCALGDKAAGARSIARIVELKPTDPLFDQQVQALADRCK